MDAPFLHKSKTNMKHGIFCTKSETSLQYGLLFRFGIFKNMDIRNYINLIFIIKKNNLNDPFYDK